MSRNLRRNPDIVAQIREFRRQARREKYTDSGEQLQILQAALSVLPSGDWLKKQAQSVLWESERTESLDTEEAWLVLDAIERKLARAQRNPDGPKMQVVAENAGPFLPQMFPYGMGGRPFGEYEPPVYVAPAPAVPTAASAITAIPTSAGPSVDWAPPVTVHPSFAPRLPSPVPGSFSRSALISLPSASQYHLPVRPVALKNPKIFAAGGPGTCPACGERFPKGTMITRLGARDGTKLWGHAPPCPATSDRASSPPPRRAPAPPRAASGLPRFEVPDPANYEVRLVNGFWVVGNSKYGDRTQEAAKEKAAAKLQRDLDILQKVATVVEYKGSSVPRWGLTLVGAAKAADVDTFHRPLLKDVQREANGLYDYPGLMRILDRADAQSFPVVVRMLDRMLDRQTEEERRAKDAQVENLVGFNKPDSYTAEQLKQWAAQITPATPLDSRLIVHYRISKLLAKYAGRQLLEITNAGAKQHGVAIRTNRGSRRRV